MIQAWLLAIGQLSDPRMRKPLVIGLAAAFVLFVLLFGGGTWLVAYAASGGGWLERVLEALGGIAAFAVAVLLFGPATLIVAGMLLDDVADAVEARHYPALPPPRRPGLAEQALMGLGLGLRAERQFPTRRVVIDDHGLAVADFALEQAAAQRRLDLLLDDPFERPRPVGGVVPGPD